MSLGCPVRVPSHGRERCSNDLPQMRGAAASGIHREAGKRAAQISDHIRQQRHLLFGWILRPHDVPVDHAARGCLRTA